MLLTDITFDSKLDHLIEIVFVKFLHCEVTYFSLFSCTVFGVGGGARWAWCDEVTIKVHTWYLENRSAVGG